MLFIAMVTCIAIIERMANIFSRTKTTMRRSKLISPNVLLLLKLP